MAHIFKPRVRETCNTDGIVSFVLSGAMFGSLAFSETMATGDTCDYVASYGDTFEEGLGTKLANGDLERTVVYVAKHANGDIDTNKVSFAPGIKTVIMTVAAWRANAFSDGGVATAKLADNAVTYAKMQDISATSKIIGRKTAAAGDPEECTLSEILDFIGSAARGDILFRGSLAWQRLAASTTGRALMTRGAAADPVWGAVELIAANVIDRLMVINGEITAAKLNSDVFASAAQVKAATATGVAVNPALLRNNPGVAKAGAFCTAGGGAVTVQSSFGLTSLVRLSNGSFRATLSTAMADTNYSVVGSFQDNTPHTLLGVAAGKTTTVFEFLTCVGTSGAPNDPTAFGFHVFGNS